MFLLITTCNAHVILECCLALCTSERSTIGQNCPSTITVGTPTMNQFTLEYFLQFLLVNTDTLCMCHGVTMSLPVDLSAPIGSLRPPALVTLSRDAVKAQQSPGS